MPKSFRKGAVGALMDEYERAYAELKTVLMAIPQETFIQIIDKETKDPDCQSIQTIMNHVVRAGYGYANYIRQQFANDWTARKKDYELHSVDITLQKMEAMLSYTIATLDDKWELTAQELMDNKIQVNWGPVYDVEQLLEHAVVHILRHRRQIERFLIMVN